MFRSDTHIDLLVAGPKPNQGEYKITRNQVLTAMAAAMGSMVVGYNSAWSSPAIASLMAPESTLEISASEASWVTSLLPLLAMAGGFIGGSLLEALGRKITIIGTSLPFIAGSLLVAFAQGVNMIYAGRCVTGFCIGIISLSLPVYLAEALHPEVRGTLGMLTTTLGNFGLMTCYVAGFWLDWSYLSLVGAIMPLPFLILMCFIPETPHYLMVQDKHEDAKAALQWLRGADTDINHELHELETNIIRAKKKSFKISDLVSKKYVKPIGISLGLMFFQQFSGINAVMFYSVSIFQNAGSNIDANLATIILGVVNIVATIISNLSVDRWGRVKLLVTSAIGMIISLFVFGAYFYFKDVMNGFVPILALALYVFSFSVGFGPIPWLMMGELFPSSIRGPAASLSTTFNWISTFVVTKTFMDLQDLLGTHGVFWMFGCILLCGCVFLWFVPETMGKSLDEIERSYLSGDSQTVPIAGRTHRVSSNANMKSTPSILL